MKNSIALLGLGTVGGGVAEILLDQKDQITAQMGMAPEIKYILDLREFPDHPLGNRVVHEYDPILKDEEVAVVAEMMGGLHPAYEFTVAALKAGKSVVTSNKAVVAEYGVELLALARENGVRYLFEASVGGGIPIIRPMTDSMQVTDIYEIAGILNGTTNYILTAMREKGASFEEVLKEAQKLGYAEANPTDDVEGYDACRKICILTAVATGRLIPYQNVKTEGIRGVTPETIRRAKEEGGAVKLIARAVLDGSGEPKLSVGPEVVHPDNPLFHIDDVYNGILVRGRTSGDLMFYGKGAGRLPTAGAVISDILDILSRGDKQPLQMLWHR